MFVESLVTNLQQAVFGNYSPLYLVTQTKLSNYDKNLLYQALHRFFIAK